MMRKETAKDILDDKNMVIRRMSKSDINWNRVKSYNIKYESFDNFISKACLMFLSMKEKTGGISDHVFPNASKVDFLRIIDKDNIIGYKILTSKEKKKNSEPPVPVTVVDLRIAPKKVMIAFQTLEEYFKTYIDKNNKRI